MKNLIEVQPIDVEEVQSETKDVSLLYQKSKELKINSQESYEVAADALKQIKNRFKEIDTQRKKITSPLDAAKKEAMELFKKPLDQLSEAESILKRSMINYTTEQERIAREETERLKRLAEKQAEEERKKLEARIERAESNGKIEKAEELKEKKESIIPINVPIVAPSIAKPSGVSYRDKWTAKVVDFSKLTDEYKLPNQSMLDKMAQASKGNAQIPGVEFICEKILSSRS